jgi:hypothetical protein
MGSREEIAMDHAKMDAATREKEKEQAKGECTLFSANTRTCA